MSKYILALLVVLMCGAYANANEYTDYHTWHKQVQSDDDPGLIVFTMDGCEPCRRLKQQLESKKMKDVHILYLDVRDGKNKTIVKFFRDAGKFDGRTPTTLAVDTEGTSIVGSFIGARMIDWVLRWFWQLFT